MSIWPKEAHPGPALERGAPSVAHRLHCRAEERWWRKRGEAHLFAGTVVVIVAVAVLNAACRWEAEEEEGEEKEEEEEKVEEDKRRAHRQAER